MILHRFLCCAAALLCTAAAFAADRDPVQAEKTGFYTKDGIRIEGIFRPPSNSGKKTFVLLHGLGSSKEEWEVFERQLAKEGSGYFAYDARGHGESTRTRDGRTVTYQSFDRPGPGSQWEKMAQDLGEAVGFLEKSKKIAPEKTVLAGASLGANVCLLYGASNASIPAVILLSPGLNYAGLEVSGAIAAFAGRPVVFAASPGDAYAYQSSVLLYRRVESNKKAAFIRGQSGHGVQMFDGSLEKKLLEWAGKR
ncbi:MAG: alpha/beta hydrolase [Endomicrobiales bacterium]